MPDRRWVRQILQGDKAAGERFVTEHYPRIYRMLRCLTGDGDIAEDLAQQTFVQAWQGLSGFKGKARLMTWLHRIAYNEYAHWLRTRRNEAPIEAAEEIPDPRAFEGLQTVAFSRALEQLTAEHRDTFLLFYVQELSVSEVAAVLDTPEGTVKSRLYNARLQLRELLSDAPAKAGASQAPCPVVLL